ncbi:anti-sigma factor family protein [Streptomyces sp. NPDC017941]|uniref:anti-sigma factor family protein n=1 Tax=Streptomyces sp. NPDC017941 TaxID=3365018 RepID=UPI0037B777A6
MTTTTDSAGHPDVAEISDLTEGLLSPSRTHDVRRHLDGCPLCTDVYESLEEIRGMLGTLPGPPRMPTDVAERIDAALAAEALLDSAAPSTAATSDASDTTGATVMADTPDALDAKRATVTSGATSAADAVPTAHVSRETSSTGPSASGPAGHPRAATGPGRRGRLRRHRRRTAVLGAVFTAAALGLGTLLIQPWSDDSKDSPHSAATDTDSTFAKNKLEKRVSTLLASEQSGSKKPGPSQPSYDMRSSPEGIPSKGSTMREDYVEVPPCIERGLGGRTPLAADKGTYEGEAAYLVVVPHDSDGDKVSAYVVDAACVSASAAPDATGKVLLTASYARQ